MTTFMIRPKPRAEIIIKEGVIYRCAHRITPTPELTILANREGFMWLSDIFRDMATRTVRPDISDPDQHEHINTDLPPFDTRLSDVLEIRLGNITPDFRKRVLKKYRITQKRRKKGSLIDRYAQLITLTRRQLRSLMKAERRS